MTSAAGWIFYYTLAVHLLGLTLLAALSTRRWIASWPVRLGAAGAIGMACVYLAGLLLLACSRRIDGMWLWGILLLFGLLMLAAARRRQGDAEPTAGPRSAQWRWYEVVLLGVAAFQVAFILVEIFWRPVAMNDDFVHWAGGAKYLFYHGFSGWDYFRQVFMSAYPFFIMINEVSLCAFTGWSDFICKLPLLLLFVDAVLLLAGEVAERGGRTAGLVFAVLLLTVPAYVRIGLDGTAEAPMACLLAMSAVLLLRHRTTGQSVEWGIAAILVGVIAVTKLEGLFAGLGLLLVFTIDGLIERRLRIQHVLAGLLPLALMVIPWLVLRHLGGCTASRLRADAWSNLAAWESYKALSAGLCSPLLPTGCRFMFLIGPYFVVAVASWLWRGAAGGDQRRLMAVILVIASMYAGGCLLTIPGQYHRLLAHLFPLMLFFAALEALALLGKKEPRIRSAGDLAADSLREVRA